jgi:hypothetical protein
MAIYLLRGEGQWRIVPPEGNVNDLVVDEV